MSPFNWTSFADAKVSVVCPEYVRREGIRKLNSSSQEKKNEGGDSIQHHVVCVGGSSSDEKFVDFVINDATTTCSGATGATALLQWCAQYLLLQKNLIFVVKVGEEAVSRPMFPPIRSTMYENREKRYNLY